MRFMGLMGVGIYLAINAFLTLLALLASKKRKRRFNANLVIIDNEKADVNNISFLFVERKQ